MHIKIGDKTDCTGCAACFNICPKQCITMEEDNCGFVYPKVNQELCINCSLCINVCPLCGAGNIRENQPISLYAAWSKDDNLRKTSTSGGIFSELAREVIKNGGCVFGAAYDENNVIVHSIAFDDKELEKLKQSKYAQSLIGDIYKQVKLHIKNKKVLFCGTPCQVAGLKSFLKEDSKNLVTVDFICRGVNSPKAFRCWLAELERKVNSEATRVWFKYKEDGWKRSPRCTRIDFKNGHIVIKRGKENSFMKGYLDCNLYIRPSCGKCKFKGTNRNSDITVGDFWGIDSALDDDMGTSFMQANTLKGAKLIDSIKENIQLYKQGEQDTYEKNICMYESVFINPQSEHFLREIGTNKSFEGMVYKYSRRSLKDIVKIILRKLLNKD